MIYRTGDGHLHALWWEGSGAVAHEDLTALATAPPAAGDPAAYVDTTRGENIVVYRGADGHVHSLYWSTGAVGHDDLSGYAGTPPAAGDPIACYSAWDDAHQVAYRSADGHVHELWWTGNNPVNGWDLSLAAAAAPATEAPPAISDPAGFRSAGTSTKHIIYRSANNHLNEIWWVPGGTPTHVDLSLSALARRAADKPAAFSVDGPNTRHVIYRSTDNEIHEIHWT